MDKKWWSPSAATRAATFTLDVSLGHFTRSFFDFWHQTDSFTRSFFFFVPKAMWLALYHTFKIYVKALLVYFTFLHKTMIRNLTFHLKLSHPTMRNLFTFSPPFFYNTEIRVHGNTDALLKLLIFWASAAHLCQKINKSWRDVVLEDVLCPVSCLHHKI